MSGREWKPGDVAMVKCADLRERIAILHTDGSWMTADGKWGPAVAYDQRPIVVLDPDDRDAVERLARAMDGQFSTRGWASQGDPDPDVLDAIQAAVRVLSEGVTP